MAQHLPLQPGNWASLNEYLSVLTSREPAAQSIVLLGDSITSQNDVTVSSIVDFAPMGWWTWANARLGQRFELLNNAGVSGNTSADMLARVNTDVLPYSPGYCFVQASGNDLGPFTAAQSISYHTAIYDQLRANGITVIATTLMPGASITGGGQAKAGQINKAIRDYARSHERVIYLPWSLSVANADNTGGFAAGMAQGDNIHQDNLGAMRMGRVVADALSAAIPPSDPLPYFNDTFEGMLTTPMLSGAQVAGAWTGGSAPTAPNTQVARSDGLQGVWQQFAVSACPNGWRLKQDDTNVGTKWNIGDSIYGLVEFQVDTGVAAVIGGETFFGAAVLECLDNIGSNITGGTRYAPRVGQGAVTTDVCNGVFRTKTMVIPATTARLRLAFRSGFTGTFRVGRMQIYKL